MSTIATLPLGEVADLQAGVGFPVDLQGRSAGDYPLAKVGDISRAGRMGKAILDSADHYVDEDDLKRLRAKVIPAGSVLFAKIGEAIRNNHRVMSGCPMLIDNNAMAAIPRASIDGRYLYEFFRTVDMYALASATTVPALRKSDLQKIRVPLPAFAEQRRIAEMLDRADALRAKRRAALAQLDSLTQSIFLDMFGDPYRNPKKLATATLGQLGKWQSGGTPPRSRKSYFSGSIPWFSSGELEGGYLVDSIEHISDAALSETSTKLVPRNALMLGMYDTAALKAAIAGVDCACNQAIAFAVIDPSLALTTYVYSAVVIGREDFRRQQRGVRQKNLNLSMVRDIRVPLPPLGLQQTFAQLIAAVEKLKATHRAALAELNALFASLQHRAFRGEL